MRHTARPAQRPHRRRQRAPVSRRSPMVLLYLAPALAIFGAFVAFPIVQTIRYSQLDWDGLSATREHVGLDNFATLLDDDPLFWRALRNNLLWGFVSVTVSLIGGLLLATLLDAKLRGRAFYRSIFFLPAVISPVVIAAVWGRIYDPQRGLANQLLDIVGVEGKVWLGEPDLALASTMVVAIWRWTGLFMLFYLAGLQTVPDEVLEAARIDGARWWRTLIHVLAPMLKPTTALLIVLGTIAAMREFEIIQILTGGGPAHATELLSTRIFIEAFELFNAGYAAAISVTLLVTTAVLAGLALRYLHRVNRGVE